MRLYGRVGEALNAAEKTFILAPPFDAFVPDVSGGDGSDGAGADGYLYRPETQDEEDLFPQTTDSFSPA